MTISIPLGTDERPLEIESATVARPPGGTPVDVRGAAAQAVSNPHGPALTDRVDPDDSVAIVITDATRDVPDDVLLEVLLTTLGRAGVDRSQVSVVIGLGLHRPMTDAEIGDMLGPHAELAINHDPTDVVTVGTVDGCPVEIGRPVAEADVVCSTGVVEPHQYAGFSGGAKTVVIGAGSESLIGYTHGPGMLARDGVRLGRIEDNPFRATLDRAGDLADIEFCCNLTHGPAGVLDVSAGDPRAVVADLASTARAALAAPLEPTRAFDAVVCGVGAPKDANLYQATRAATYVALGAHNPLAVGGRLVVPAELPEGVGSGTGERRFGERLRAATSAASLYDEMRGGYEPGAQRAFVLARVLREYDVWVTDNAVPDVLESRLCSHAPRAEDALGGAEDVLVVPDAINTLLVDG